MRHALAATALALILAGAAPAQEVRRIDFAAGASAATARGEIRGYDYILYELRAAAGQRMRIRMASPNTAAYFNVFAPGKGPGDAAIFIGSISGPVFDAPLAASGVYSVQVYMMRSAARRGERAAYRLYVSITGSPDG